MWLEADTDLMISSSYKYALYFQCHIASDDQCWASRYTIIGRDNQRDIASNSACTYAYVYTNVYILIMHATRVILVSQ